MIRLLSHKIGSAVPVYGSSKASPDLRKIKSIEDGDVCRTFWVGWENHWGTHIDCPAHFFANGMRVSDYEADFWFFQRPKVLDIVAEPGQIIFNEIINAKIDSETDLLILKSGWGRFRGEEIYSLENPGLDPRLGSWLRSEYPGIRAVGFDWVSISSFSHRELGRQAHRAFLDPDGHGHPILIIEDMDLSFDLESLKEVWAVPLLVEGIDSAPCTVLGVFK